MVDDAQPEISAMDVFSSQAQVMARTVAQVDTGQQKDDWTYVPQACPDARLNDTDLCADYDTADGLAAARGLMAGILIGVLIYIAVAAAIEAWLHI